MIHRCHDVAAACRGGLPRLRSKTALSRCGRIRSGQRPLLAAGLHSPSPAARHRVPRASVRIRAVQPLSAHRQAARGCCGPAAGHRGGPAVVGEPADRRHPRPPMKVGRRPSGHRDDHHHHGWLPAAPENDRNRWRCHQVERTDPGDRPGRRSREIRREFHRVGRGRRVGRGGGGHDVPGPHPNRRDLRSAARLGQLVRRAPRRPSHRWPAVPRGAARQAAQWPGVRGPGGLRPAVAAEPAGRWLEVVRSLQRGPLRCRDRRLGRPSRCSLWPGDGGGEAGPRVVAAVARQPVGPVVPDWRRRPATRPDQPKDLSLLSYGWSHVWKP